MFHRLFLLLVSLLLCCCSSVIASTATTTATSEESSSLLLQQNLVDWVLSKGGSFHAKQEYRRVEPNDPYSPYGMFATERIEMGQVLYTVPWECILTAGTDQLIQSLHCDTIRLLISELQNEKDSDYAPYVQYLQSFPQGQVPSAWSDAGKDVLELISGHDQLPPYEPVLWLDKDWKNECKGHANDTFGQHAAMLSLSKGEDDMMIPLLDMYNHANGRYTNADGVLEHSKYHQLIATRTIEKGEQIMISHNKCRDCDDRTTYGTPELLRDYGIVEPLPQSYYFTWFDFGFTVDTKPGNDDVVQVQWAHNQKPSNDNIAYLQSQYQRLLQVVQPELQQLAKDKSVPTREWNVLTQYYESLVFALQSALQAAGVDDTSACPGGTYKNGKCRVGEDGYDDLQDMDLRFNNYQSYCPNDQILRMHKESMKLIDRDVNDKVQSPFQLLTFLDRQGKEVQDKCLELDDILQICSSFRPHYHDYVTHFPARYKEHVKRVVFVGGGDSMVLHEMLKYPNIELIVGLELDQTVVRQSMKQFRTQPHFDDSRVQWWFGDATKSLLMLPKDYFGSFDMVMVDLSETVMSFSVIKHLDIMEALSLLLKPDGIMIKNDLHLRKMSEIFDYTIQLSVTNVPIICEQAFVLGSNNVDFLRPPVETILKGHDVEMQLLEPVKDLDDSFKLVQKYRHNNARKQGKCVNLVNDSDVKLKRAGLFMVVEAENAKGPLQGDKLEKALMEAIQQQGLEHVSTITSPSETSGDHVVIVTKEGVIVARTWPKEKYCAFDIHLWGRFNKMDAIRDALVDAVGSKAGSVSSFRIIVGGMRGTDSWKQDKQEIGPKIFQNRDCTLKHGSGEINQDVIHTVVEETLNLIDEKNAVVAILCGTKEESCGSLDVVQKSGKVGTAVAIYTCSNIKDIEFMGDAAVRMSACELETLKHLRDAVAKNGRISSLIVDSTATIGIAKIVRNIVANPRHQAQFLMPRLVCVAPMFDKRDDWRRVMFDRSRKNLSHEYKFRVDMTLMGATEEVEVNVLSTGDSRFFTRIVEYADAVTNRTSIPFDINAIVGAPPKDSDEYQPKHFTPEDYGIESGEEQFKKQRPLGHHIVSHLKTGSDEKSTKEFALELVAALNSALKAAKFSKVEVQVIEDVGSGVVALAVAPEGTGIAVWDGNQRITVNMFTFDSDNADAFFKKFTKKLSSAKVMSKDEQPRGIGKVVNFARDLSP